MLTLDAEGEMLGCLLLLLPTQIVQQYDRIKDVTTLRADLGDVYVGDKHSVAVHLFTRYTGDGRTERIGGVLLYFFSISKDGWKYLNYHPIVLLLDDATRLRFDPKHDGDVQTTQLCESMYVHPTDEQFRQLVGANSVEGVVGNDQFALTAKQKAVLKRYSALMADPAAEVRQPVLQEDEARKPASPPERKYTKEEQQRIEESAKAQKAESYLRIAELLRKSKKYKQARKIYEEVIRDFPKHPAAEKAKEQLKTLPKG